jgi:hypothetical protein
LFFLYDSKENYNKRKLPKDILYTIVEILIPHQIITRCSISKMFNKLCKDKQFWKFYANTKYIPKLNYDTLLNIVLISYIVVMDDILEYITWLTPDLLNKAEKQIEYDRIEDDNSEDSIEYDTERLTDSDWNKIIFNNPVKLSVPDYTFLNTNPSTREYGYKKIILYPDKEYGSTLRHVLEQIYRNMNGLSTTDNLIPSNKLYGKNVRIRHNFFEGLKYDTETDTFEPEMGNCGLVLFLN